jgi:hypothetical protein
MRRLALILIAGAVLILLAGCKGNNPPSVEPSAQALTGKPTSYPATGGSEVLKPEDGGAIVLSEGAEVEIPPSALSETTLVSLREANSHPTVPVPRTSLGPAYELTLDGAELNGVAILKLPLPQGITPEEYDIGAYRWTGRSWERMSGRAVDGKVQIATQQPGLFALQGTWRLASAALGLALPPGGLQPGMTSIPFTMTGQYRFSALPALQRGYTPVRLTLKRDTSGGAGQVTGDVTLDETVAETTVWFQPEPGQSRGEVQFEHVFEISPGSLNVLPGNTSHYYAVFEAEDSSAPTTQLSTGVDYTHVLPLRIVDRDVVRPEMTNAADRPLQWHIQLNGQRWMDIPANQTTLSIDEVLAKGGIGDYSITLETQSEGKWMTASNAVSVKLAPPPTETPIWTETPSGTETPEGVAQVATPTPGGTMPATPTRRPRPTLPTDVTPAGTPTPVLSVTPTATGQGGSQEFWADSYNVAAAGDCTTLHWNVQNVTEVYLDGKPVTGVESRSVCPTVSTTYVLRSVSANGSQERRVTILVGAQGATPFDFSADAYQVAQGSCTTLRWRAQGVSFVYLNGEGVAGEATRSECPKKSTTYTLRVVNQAGASTSRSITIAVLGSSGIPISFWAEQYTMNKGDCTVIHWSVDGVQAVYFGETGNEDGVNGVGSQRVCPDGEVSYTLNATATDGSTDSRELTLWGEEPFMGENDVIAHAGVREIVSTKIGEEPGWNLVLDGVDKLFSGDTNCCGSTVTIQISQAMVDQQAESGVPIDWPINAGQLVEFRAMCTDNTCRLDAGPPNYLRLRSK